MVRRNAETDRLVAAALKGEQLADPEPCPPVGCDLERFVIRVPGVVAEPGMRVVVTCDHPGLPVSRIPEPRGLVARASLGSVLEVCVGQHADIVVVPE
jgi:hypothetical protein